MGSWDDTDNHDECLRLQNGRYIYVEDIPGWHGSALPRPHGTTFPGFVNTAIRTNPNARQVVFKARFAEWVNFKHKGHGINWTTISRPKFFHWHSTTWLVKIKNQWRLQTNFSTIGRGTQRIGAEP